MAGSHRERMLALHALLDSQQPLWRPAPFTERRLPWMTARSALAEACLALDDAELSALEAEPTHLQHWIAAHLPELAGLDKLTALPACPRQAHPLPPRWQLAIPGRKAEQIAHFAQHTRIHGDVLVDWCSGKAHLGRTLAMAHSRTLVAVERDFGLCREGRRQARQAGVEAEFICADALHAPLRLNPRCQVLALHACGDLHRSLVDAVCREPVQGLALAPCCYALWLEGTYTPHSQLAARQALPLTRAELQLAVQESVTGSARTLHQSQTLAAWRLGFDTLQRDLRGIDDYLPCPSLPLSALHWGFDTVCRHLAAAKQLSLPTDINWQHYAEHGAQRWQEVRRLQLPRHALRRALELWLVLDLALALEEADYRVSLGEFCPRAVTPRNLLLQAVR